MLNMTKLLHELPKIPQIDISSHSKESIELFELVSTAKSIGDIPIEKYSLDVIDEAEKINSKYEKAFAPMYEIMRNIRLIQRRKVNFL